MILIHVHHLHPQGALHVCADKGFWEPMAGLYASKKDC